MEHTNIIQLENKIYYKKRISSAKTMLMTQIKPKCNISEYDSTFSVGDIVFNSNKLSKDFTNAQELILNSRIIISTNPNPYENTAHLAQIPAFIGNLVCKNSSSEDNIFTLDICFGNLFPNNIYYVQIQFIYLFICFDKMIDTNLFKNVSVNLNFISYIAYNNNIQNILNIPNIPNISGLYYLIDEFAQGHINIDKNVPITFIQEIKLQKIKCAKSVGGLIKKKIFTDIMCRGMWLKFDIDDWKNLCKIELLMNERNRFSDIMTKDNIETLCDVKIFNSYVLVFLNLNFDFAEWNIPKDFISCQEIYSNSLNFERIDKMELKLNFNPTHINICRIDVAFLGCNCIAVSKNHIRIGYNLDTFI